MDHTMFTAQADAVARAGYRAVLWDLRGHGVSAMDPGIRFTADDALADIGALLDALPFDRPVLIGHSLGGNLAQAFVRDHPERVGGLICVDSTWNAGPLSGGERFALRLAAPLLGLVPKSRLPRMMARASVEMPDALAQVERVFARMPKRTFLDVWRATTSLVSPDPAYRSPVPLGLVWGEKDGTGNIARAMRSWAAVEHIEEHVIPNAGHIVTLDAPDASTHALLEILNQWRPRLAGAGGAK